MDDMVFNQKLVENSITMIKKQWSFYQLIILGNNKIAYVKLGKGKDSKFISRLKDYTKVDVISGKNLDEVLNRLKGYKNCNCWISYFNWSLCEL